MTTSNGGFCYFAVYLTIARPYYGVFYYAVGWLYMGAVVTKRDGGTVTVYTPGA